MFAVCAFLWCNLSLALIFRIAGLMNLSSFFAELKRRNVYKVAVV
jgi:hypothetical protein